MHPDSDPGVSASGFSFANFLPSSIAESFAQERQR
jgi:hypothetical protein